MAQQFTTDQGTLYIPGAYSTYKVQTSNSGLSTSGVLMLVGEADAGPDYTLEENLEANAFGPDQEAEVVAKYRSGPLVDAFRAAATPANDPNITGAPSRIILVKTNKATKALTELKSGSVYGYVLDASAGVLGNQIQIAISQKNAEDAPATGAFAFIPAGAGSVSVHVNGVKKPNNVSFTASSTPTTVATALTGLGGLTVTGGDERTLTLPATSKLSFDDLTSNSGTIHSDATAPWPTVKVGDVVTIEADSVIAGTLGGNVGSYIVKEAGSTFLKVQKMTAGTTANVTETAATATPKIKAYAPITVSVSGDPIEGVGKTLEIAALDAVAPTCFYKTDTTPVTWLSKDGAAVVVSSATEKSVKFTASRAADGIDQSVSFGGEIALRIGFKGNAGTVTVGNGFLTITTDGEVNNFDLSQFKNLDALATSLKALPNVSCKVGSGSAAQWPATALDSVTDAGCASAKGGATLLLKADAYRAFRKISEEISLVIFRNAQMKASWSSCGLPPVKNATSLSGGSKGATSAQDVVDAFEALESVQGNFLVPLFSRDAAEDIADGLTDAASMYEIDAINAAAKTHVIAMSALKRRRNRQAFLSKKGSMAAAKDAAATIASYRCALTFQDVKNVGGDGTIKQFQPWMASAVAAGMQAAGFYRSLVHKTANISGALQAARDFNDRNDSDLENALQAGLLPLQRSDTGGYRWVSDQTTYGKDGNFVFNSIQSVYAADIIAMTTAQRMERAFVGQSVADVSAGLALSSLESILDDFMRLKLIAPSDDAPKGYKNAKIKISGPSMQVSMEVKLAGSIYFIPISFVVSQVQQTAG